ncbi:MAG: hypothetical protein AABW47_03685 [Nanoarchaeota archaeon]
MKSHNKHFKVRIFPSFWSKILFALIAIPIFVIVSLLVILNLIIIGIILLVLFIIGFIIFLIWRMRLEWR